MDSNERGWRDKEHGKIAAYHALTLYLQAKHPRYQVLQTTFIVGVSGSVIEGDWKEALVRVGLEEAAVQRVTEKTLRAAVGAFDTTLSVRQAAREALGVDAAGLSPHPSQRDRPPVHHGRLAVR